MYPRDTTTVGCTIPSAQKTLENRLRKGVRFLPVGLFEDPEATLHLVDGLHHLIAFRTRSTDIIPAIISTDLRQALTVGIAINGPKDGKQRHGLDASKGLSLLATALGSKITEPEAASLGLRLEDHEILTPTVLKLYPPITLPSPLRQLPSIRGRAR